MAIRKLIPKKTLPPEDSVSYEKKHFSAQGRQIDIIHRAARAWDRMSDFRKMRERNKRYMFGDQWGDMVEHCGRTITEEEYIVMQGNIPLKNNLIRNLTRTIMGTFRNQNKKPVCIARDREEQKLGEIATALLEYNIDLNQKKELDARLFEEFVISGLPIQKETYQLRQNKMDCWTDNISPNVIFMEGSMNDVRMTDLTMIGEIHDMTFGQVTAAYAHSEEEVHKLQEIYKNARDRGYMNRYTETFSYNKQELLSFLTPNDLGLCRIIEVWTKEQRRALWCHDYLKGDAYIDSYTNLEAIKNENASRLEDNKIKDTYGNYIYDEQGNIMLQMPVEQVPLIEYEYRIEEYWYYRFMSPFGDVIDEGESPYEHGEHPYTVRPYPLIDGEIHPIVSDVIDQQRYINHYIILNDFVVKASAKGVLIVDEASIPEDMAIEDIADEYTKYNGVIKLRLKDGAKAPQQLINQNRVAGLQDMINLQKQLMEDISGIHGALQGKTATSGTSALLYQTQANNASNSIVDILEFFSTFIKAADKKKLSNILQFYDEPMTVKVAGRSSVYYYDPTTMGGVDFDLAISESYDTPVYRAVNNELLIQFLQAGQINLEQLLQVGQFPFADQLLQLIQSQRQEMDLQQQALAQQGVLPQKGIPQ